MRLLTRYALVEILKIFTIVLVAVIGLYICVDFMEKVDDFLEAGATVDRAFVYLFYKIPFIVAQITPIGVLLSVLIAFGLMSKHNEITAMHSTGISTNALLIPALSFGFSAAVLLAITAEAVAPFATVQANRIWLTEAKKEKIITTRDHNIWLKTDRAIVHLQYYQHKTGTARGISYNLFNKDFKLVHRIDARTGRFADGKWVLQKVVEQVWQTDSGHYNVKTADRLVKDLGLTPEDMKTVAREASEMSFMDLFRYIRKVEAEGYDATHYWVDFHAKAAFPTACVVMALIGLGVAVSGRVREGMVASIIYGLGIVFVFWVLFSFCISLGYGGLLAPAIAAWLANVVFFCLGWMFLLYAR